MDCFYLLGAFCLTSSLSFSLSFRSMWLLQQLSGLVVSSRGFLKSVSIATLSSSWVPLPTFSPRHTPNLSSSPPANHCLWTALEWTQSRPTRATRITRAAQGDQTDMGMFSKCLLLHLTVCLSSLSHDVRDLVEFVFSFCSKCVVLWTDDQIRV